MTQKQAIVKTAIKVKNSLENQKDIQILSEVFTADGTLVSSEQTKVQSIQEHSLIIRQNISVENPQLWDLDNPYQYQLKNSILHNGKIVDVETHSFGIRTIGYSKNGFELNGKRVFLNGANIHHDAGCEGAAVSNWTWYTRLKTLKEMGCNSLRLAHNPHSPELLKMCDSMGILVISELADKWELNEASAPDGSWTAKFPAFGFKEHWRDYTKISSNATVTTRP